MENVCGEPRLHLVLEDVMILKLNVYTYMSIKLDRQNYKFLLGLTHFCTIYFIWKTRG